jgi:hypothetical protein
MGIANVAKGGNIMKVTDLNWDELQTLIREAVHEELRDLITDPDWGPQLPDRSGHGFKGPWPPKTASRSKK